MDLRDCTFSGEKRFRLADCPTNTREDKDLRTHYEELTTRNNVRMGELQGRLYAEAREGVVVMLQAMDAAGKDSTIRGVMSGVNPQGVSVTSFKQPSKEELAHDYLWRAVRALPERGNIGLFNRSYYEDVLVARVHGLQHGYAMPARTTDMGDDEFYERRYRQIRDFEEYLWENGYRLVKVFLNVSLAEQRKRFLERIDDEAKNWKFSSSDVSERGLWPQYMDAYERCIDATATKHSPWYVIPADQKWFARWLVSEAIVSTLEACDPHYPELPAEERAKLVEYRAQLAGEA